MSKVEDFLKLANKHKPLMIGVGVIVVVYVFYRVAISTQQRNNDIAIISSQAYLKNQNCS